MSYINAYVRRIFGFSSVDAQRAQFASANQLKEETFTATTYRAMKGPQKNGHFSYHVVVGTGSSPVGTLTVWYSNLPEPDATNDAHWVQDTSISSLDLGVVANTFVNVGNVNAEHIRFKAARTSGTISLILWARVEGVENR